MDKKVMKKWVEALRSGEYEKGKGQLRDEDQYCCLGVLCEVYAKENNISPELVYSPYNEGLPKTVQFWAGMEDSMGGFGGEKNLADINDCGKKETTFEEISYIIEENYEKL